jgi:hypothetical protein
MGAPAKTLLRRLDMRPADLDGGQRAIYLALRSEARQPTVRLRYRTLCLALLVSSAIGLATGWWIGGGR